MDSYYKDFQADFKHDTGLEAKDNVDKYLMYYQARVNLLLASTISQTSKKIDYSINTLPPEFMLKFGEFIRDNDFFKQLRKKLSLGHT